MSENDEYGMDGPRSVPLSSEDRSNSRYSSEAVQYALEGLHQDGLLVLKGVVDVAHVDHLRGVMGAETQIILQERAGLYNQGVESNILQNPPVARKDCLFDDVFFNPYVVQVANA
ncbi:hypothetical protein LTR62_006116 [Meristemomyces frigidus]|uniref:Uncharacterized protein n=1 Tax=Meristemomyces frigidus TaxID=1508187 RepID=A0AAN7TEU4_9PEZI|nr:hypothetical protein LTR62_006116 [Meristemomyces frigidus]